MPAQKMISEDELKLLFKTFGKEPKRISHYTKNNPANWKVDNLF